jgi:hypothetical protein
MYIQYQDLETRGISLESALLAVPKNFFPEPHSGSLG